MQGDGNAVIYSMIHGGSIWSTGTSEKELLPSIFTYQSDGNLVMYDSTGKIYWSSGTNGKTSAYLSMQDDGNLVLYTSLLGPVWSSGTPSGNISATAIGASGTYTFLTSNTTGTNASGVQGHAINQGVTITIGTRNYVP